MNRPQPSPQSAAPDRLIGTLVNGKYRVTSSVGSGGMGKIYRAEQLPLGRPVALKILHVQPPERGPSSASPDLPNLKKRFFREASVLSKLQHPNIVTIYDYGTFDAGSEQYFIAMEFLAGKTLAERAAEGPMPIAAAVRIAWQVARGLEEAHAQGLVHRDLKPSNVMLVTGRDGEERVKIIDFGVVKLVGEGHVLIEEELTLEGAVVGSPKYMAPEQFLSTRTLDRRADVWALGVVLYKILAARAPFEAETTGWLIHDVLNGPAPRLRSARPDAPPELDAIVARCLEKSPARRFADMGEVAAALEGLGIVPPRSDRSEVWNRTGASGSGAREKLPSMPTLPPESMVAVSTRNGTRATGRRNKLIFGVTVAGVLAAAGTISTRHLNATARPPDVAPTFAPTTAIAVPEGTFTVPPPLASPQAQPAPTPSDGLVSSGGSLPPAASALAPLRAKPVGRSRLLPNANAPSAPPPGGKPSRDDDIPAVR